MAYSGVVASWGGQKGYGFIASEQVGGDIFFGRQSLPQELQAIGDLFPMKGKNVQFDLKAQADASGKPQASLVKIMVAEGEMCVGTIKSFNAAKGFGFIGSSSMEGQDFFFSRRDVPMQLQGAPLQGMVTAFKVTTSPDGKIQARELVFAGGAGMAPRTMLVPQRGQPMQMQMQMQMGPPRGNGQRLQGTVKTYNTERGFGFASSPAVSGDVYFKGQGIPFQPGSPIEFTLKTMPDGKAQARDVAPGGSQQGGYMGGPQQGGYMGGPQQGGYMGGPQQGGYMGGGGGDGGTQMAFVSSYSPKNGYGFMTVEGLGDVFFKKTLVPAHLQEADLKGIQASIAIRMTPDGKPQCARAQFHEGGAPPPQMMGGGMKRLPAPPQYGGGYGAPPQAKRQRMDTAGAGPPTDGGGPFTGVIGSYNAQKGFGFIQTEAAPSDVFFSGKKLPAGFAELGLQGKNVVFHLAWTPDGKPQANNIQVV